MRTVYERRNYIPPWVWVAIALGVLLVILIVWMVAAGTRQTDNDQYGTAPGETPTQPVPFSPPQGSMPPVATPPATPAAPTVPVIPRDQQVRVYIHEQPRSAPRVVAVPEREKKPSVDQGYQAVDLPGKFGLFDKEWNAVPGALLTADSLSLQDIGQEIEGRPVYVLKNDRTPYEALYIETTAGSGNYIKYQTGD